VTIHELYAYLTVDDAGAAIAFYTSVFGAKETMRLAEPSGRIGHAELELGGSTLMLNDEFPEHGFKGPKAYGGTPVTIHLHVDDCDALIAKAVEAGATLVHEPADHFYGERSGRVRDPWGHERLIGHSIEEVSNEEMQRPYTALFED
jgi:uncharacterized glyoxalase superfamily protein PhnB